jgi:hypothetical protein
MMKEKKMTRSALLKALNKFALNSPGDGYDWGALYNDDRVFDELNNDELLALYNDYNNYMKGE